MPSPDFLAAFVTVTAVFAYAPGPAMLYATAQTITRGRRAGLLASLGLHLGGYVHVVAASIGLAALLEAVPALHIALKAAGALFVAWLGMRMILSPGEIDIARPAQNLGSRARTMRESLVVEVLNPKTAIFFVAFLPQFVEPAGAWPVWAQLLTLGTCVNFMFSSADLACVVFAGTLFDRLRTSRLRRRIAHVAGGTILVGLGAHLMLQRAP